MPAAILEEKNGIGTVEEVKELEARLRRGLRSQVRELTLEVRSDGLVLRGRTPTYYGKQLVQHAVMAVSQLPILANIIEVD